MFKLGKSSRLPTPIILITSKDAFVKVGMHIIYVNIITIMQLKMFKKVMNITLLTHVLIGIVNVLNIKMA